MGNRADFTRPDGIQLVTIFCPSVWGTNEPRVWTARVVTKAKPVGSKGFKCAALLEVPRQTQGIWSLAAACAEAEQAQPH